LGVEAAGDRFGKPNMRRFRAELAPETSYGFRLIPSDPGNKLAEKPWIERGFFGDWNTALRPDRPEAVSYAATPMKSRPFRATWRPSKLTRVVMAGLVPAIHVFDFKWV
jgi:hypothetical protein